MFVNIDPQVFEELLFLAIAFDTIGRKEYDQVPKEDAKRKSERTLFFLNGCQCMPLSP